MTDESLREGFIVWYPSCNGCYKDKCTQPESYQKEVHDARECKNFSPDNEQGVFVVENRAKKKEKVYLKTVNDEVVYVSKAGSNVPLCCFRLRDWHRVSTKKTLKQIARLKATVAHGVLSEISMYLQGLRLKHASNNGEDFITACLLTPPLTKEEIAKYKPKAERWLKDPKLLLLIKQALDKQIVGETKNKMTITLSADTKLLAKKLHLILTGGSSVGKNYLANQVLKLHPNVLDFTRITKRAADYLTDIDLSNYIIYIREMKGIEAADYSIRLLMTEGHLTLLTVEKDPRTGKMKKRVVRVKGEPVIISTLTFGTTTPEMSTRTATLTLDESTLQTREILRHQGDEFATLFKKPFTEEEMIFRTINQTLPPIRVLVPYSPKIAEIFPEDKLRIRRDFKKLESIIEAIASYYRRQRFRLKLGNETVVIANIDDLRYAIAIFWDILVKSMTGIEKPLVKFYNKLKENLGDISFTKHDAKTATNLSESTCKNYLWKLCKANFLVADKTEKPYSYSFSYGKITVHKLNKEIDDKLFNQEDFKQFLLKKCNLKPTDKELQDYYKRWQGFGSFKIEKMFDTEIDMNSES